jgi:hypothetical protein
MMRTLSKSGLFAPRYTLRHSVCKYREKWRKLQDDPLLQVKGGFCPLCCYLRCDGNSSVL